MSGKCYSCASNFSWLKKEHGCKNCGYAFCKDCVSKTAKVPRHRNEVHKVCNDCYLILTGQKTKVRNSDSYSPPEALKKRLAALEQKQNTSVSPASSSLHHHAQSKQQPNYTGMSKEDIALAQRLEKLKEDRRKEKGAIPSQNEIEKRLGNLKEDRAAPPGEKEMEERLARLRGQDPTTINKPFVYKPDKRSEQQQIDDLMDEMFDEVRIDSHGEDPVPDIQGSLSNLQPQSENNLNKAGGSNEKNYSKNIPYVSDKNKSPSGENVDIDEMNSLMKQVAEEMEMDAHRAVAGLQKDKELMARLTQLKKDRKKNNNTDDDKDATNTLESDCDSSDEDTAIKNILKKALEESKLDEDLVAGGYTDVTTNNPNSNKSEALKSNRKNKPSGYDDEQESDPDEFPWCCICNQDATIRCIGCDYDLYCDRCFKEGHDLIDMKEHKRIPFKPNGR